MEGLIYMESYSKKSPPPDLPPLETNSGDPRPSAGFRPGAPSAASTVDTLAAGPWAGSWAVPASAAVAFPESGEGIPCA